MVRMSVIKHHIAVLEQKIRDATKAALLADDTGAYPSSAVEKPQIPDDYWQSLP